MMMFIGVCHLNEKGGLRDGAGSVERVGLMEKETPHLVYDVDVK